MTPPSPDARRYPVLGVAVDALSPARAVERVFAWISAGRRDYVCVANVHVVMETRRDPSYAAVVAGAGLTVPDGMPLVWMGRLQGESVERVYGPDLTLLLCARAAAEGRPVAFYGGTPEVAARLAAALPARIPGLRVAAAIAPPFRPLTDAEDAADVAALDASGADLVFVGLGCPRQERWMAAHRARLQAPVLVGVGAAFDFHAGSVRQAPRWMMGLGLEWLFRLGQEPRRLWHRYLVYNPLFVLGAVLQLAGLRRYDPPRPR